MSMTRDYAKNYQEEPHKIVTLLENITLVSLLVIVGCFFAIGLHEAYINTIETINYLS